MTKRLVFYLLGKKGYNVLATVIDRFDTTAVLEVVIAKDEGVIDDFAEAIATLCKSNGIMYRQRTESSSPIPQNEDILRLAIGWRWIIKDVDGLVVLHDSPLPKYRGVNPLVNMLIDGQQKIGVTALMPVTDYDAGPIIAQRTLDIEYPIKISQAIEKIIPLYCEIVVDIGAAFLSNRPFASVNQLEADATYSPWRDGEDYRINWTKDAEYISRMIDAVGAPYGGARTSDQSRALIVHTALPLPDIIVSDRETHVGKIIRKIGASPVVICGRGLIRIDKMNEADSGIDALPKTFFRTRFK